MAEHGQIDIAIVVGIAAILVVLSLALSFLAMRRMADPHVRGGMAWLTGANLCFLIATLALQARDILPFAASAGLVVAGAHLGILAGHAALLRALGQAPRAGPLLALAGVVIGAQAGIALALQSVEPLFLSSSLFNGLIASWLAWQLWPAARPLGRAQAWLATLPFAVIALAYLGRLPAVLLSADPQAAMLATLLIVFVLAIAALQWGFALISFGAARLNRRLRAERIRAEAANRLKIRFLSNMSHELRTPLNGILGMAQTLEADLPPGPAQDMARTIGQSGTGLLRLLTDILALSDLKAGQAVPGAVPVVPARLLTALVAEYRPQATARGLLLVLRLADPAGASDAPLHRPMLIDAPRLRQALERLLDNALRFTPAGQVTIEARCLPQLPPAPAGTTAGTTAGIPPDGDARDEGGACRLRIRIRDTGIGIDPAQRARLLEPFVQSDDSAQRSHDGAGLGLAIAVRLMALMDGTLELDGAPGQGTCATLELPLIPAAGAAPMEPEPVAEAAAQVGPGRRIQRERLQETPPDRPPDRPQGSGRPETGADPGSPPGSPSCTTPATAPSGDAPASTVPATISGMGAGALAGLRLLLAEDNLTNQRVIKAFLAGSGAELVIVGNGRQAVEMLAGGADFDLLIFDVAMPEMDGPTALRRIRAAADAAPPPQATPPPAIVVTANVSPAEQADYRDAGFLECLAKPVRRPALWAAVARHARRPGPTCAAASAPAPGQRLQSPPPAAIVQGRKGRRKRAQTHAQGDFPGA